jgi:hypothetical protein
VNGVPSAITPQKICGAVEVGISFSLLKPDDALTLVFLTLFEGVRPLSLLSSYRFSVDAPLTVAELN